MPETLKTIQSDGRGWSDPVLSNSRMSSEGASVQLTSPYSRVSLGDKPQPNHKVVRNT
jgi:hypothetical protein